MSLVSCESMSFHIETDIQIICEFFASGIGIFVNDIMMACLKDQLWILIIVDWSWELLWCWYYLTNFGKQNLGVMRSYVYNFVW